jgi:hypothetical protein
MYLYFERPRNESFGIFYCNLVYIWKAWNGNFWYILLSFSIFWATWYILCSFGILSGHLV